MSFLEAIRAMGERELKLDRAEDGPLSDIDSFTQMPMKLGEAENEKPQEIQVILDVPNVSEIPLCVKGIKGIELADFFAGQEDDRAKKRRYLYRDPVSPRANWRYSPLYKLGKGVVDAQQALVGTRGDWRKDDGSRFYKLYSSMLFAFEERGIFSKGSVDRIMDALVANVDRLAEHWADKKRSYILLFGFSDGDRFFYPVDVPAFLEHFRVRLAEANTSKSKSGGKQSKKGASVRCGICHNEEENPVNLDKVFTFATFDKKSFLPGLDGSSASKVFPLCKKCYRLLSEGRNVLDEKFLDAKSISGLRIYTVPELTGETAYTDSDSETVADMTTAFLQQGLQNEEFLGPYVLRRGKGLVYHFLFWEPNNKQMRILLMVEDVPPSRLSELDAVWKETVSIWDPFGWQGRDGGVALQSATLWQAIKVLWLIMLGGEYNEDDTDAKAQKKQKRILGLGGKNKEDANVLRDRLLELLGCLLRGERIDVMWIKKLIVSRLPGLCANSEWAQWSGAISARFWNAVVDFLYRVNNKYDNIG